MRASRLLSILMVLQARGRVTAGDMAREFEVSERTIYRDIDELSAAGVPVYSDRGRDGGFQLRSGYQTRLTGLSADEAEALLLAGLPGPAGDLGFGSSLAAAERKMLATLPEGASARASKLRQRVLLDPLDWYRRIERPPCLAAVTRAVWTQQRIRIRYQSWTASRDHTLEPFGLVIKAGNWYLVARCDGKLRSYKLASMETLEELPTTFRVPKSFNLALHWSEQLTRFEKSLQHGRATLRVMPQAMSRIERLGADAADAVRTAEADANGGRRAEIPIEGIEHAAMELLGFGPSVEVLAPPQLRQRLRELARQTQAVYARRRRPQPVQSTHAFPVTRGDRRTRRAPE